ncbi:MAG: type III pantothenate kinase [Gemmatimonadota bacterium]
MILALDVGNTETVVGLFHEETLHAHWRIGTRPERTVDEMGLLLRSLMREAGVDADAVAGAGIASVVPPLTPVIVEACQRYVHADVAVIDARSGLPITLDVEEPLSVGADRIVNTLAAARLYARDTIAVDFGTATTFDCIGADGVFRGGVITPGIQTGAETLIRRTAKLPRVDIDQPTRVMGRRTETAIQSGIFFSAVDAVDGIVRRIREEWGAPDILVVATGGLAPLVAPHCRSIDRIEPFLTLQGILLAFEHLRA